MGANGKGKTFSLKDYLTVILLTAALLIGLFGCAHRPQIKTPSIPELVEAELGTIAVVSAPIEPKFTYDKPMTKGQATLENVFKKLPKSVFSGTDPQGTAYAIVLSPFIVTGIAIYSVAEGETKKTIEETEKTLNRCLFALRVQEAMQERVLSLGRERTRHTFVVPGQSGPKVQGEEISYDSLKGKGIDTVLEISVHKIRLWRRYGATNPPLRLFVTVSSRVIRVADGKELTALTFEGYECNSYKFTQWAANNCQLFKEELDRCFQNLTIKIIRDCLMVERSALTIIN